MLVFVYGTLKKGQGNNFMLNGEEFIGKAATTESLNMASIGVPVVMRLFVDNMRKMAEPVIGEVYNISKKLLKILDQLEGHPDLYKRTAIKVRLLESQKVVKAYIYFFVPGQIHVEKFFDYETDGRTILNRDGCLIIRTENGQEWFE